MKFTNALAVVAMMAFAGSAVAASPAPAPAKPAAAALAPSTMNAADKEAISKKCSADADAKGLHGKERKKFREECKMAAKKN